MLISTFFLDDGNAILSEVTEYNFHRNVVEEHRI